MQDKTQRRNRSAWFCGIAAVLILPVLIGLLWVRDVWQDRQHTVLVKSGTPLYAGNGDEDCESTQVASIPPGLPFESEGFGTGRTVRLSMSFYPTGVRGTSFCEMVTCPGNRIYPNSKPTFRVSGQWSDEREHFGQHRLRYRASRGRSRFEANSRVTG